MNKENLTFGDRLANLRKENGWSQQVFSDKIGIATSSLWYFERNEKLPAVESLIKIADFYGVSTDYLLGRSHFRSASDTKDPVTQAIISLNDRDYFCVKSLIDEMKKSYPKRKKKQK